MGLTVRENLPGLNSSNSLNKATKAQKKTMQKLASGYKINSAGDDASGLAVSQKMRNQITALDTSIDNCEDGVNLIQTTEGYIAEVHDMLNRMTELSEKAANAVLGDTERDALQNEMNQLCAEIDRIGSSAQFNGRKLLDGSIGSNNPVKIFSDKFSGKISVMSPTNRDFMCGQFLEPVSFEDGMKYEYAHPGTTFPMDSDGNYSIELKDQNGNIHTEKFAPKDGDKVYIPKGAEKPVSVNGVEIELTNAPAPKELVGTYSLSDHKWYDQYNNEIKFNIQNFKHEIFEFRQGLPLQIGETSTTSDRLNLNFNSIHSNTLFEGLNGFVNTTNDTTNTDSTAAVKIIKPNAESTYNDSVTIDIRDAASASAASDAIRHISSYISDERGRAGAYQNRMDHTINNLTTASENTTAAKSRITDTDMAREMTSLTSKNVIAQAAQSMLAQANTQPQSILSLLQQQ